VEETSAAPSKVERKERTTPSVIEPSTPSPYSDSRSFRSLRERPLPKSPSQAIPPLIQEVPEKKEAKQKKRRPQSPPLPIPTSPTPTTNTSSSQGSFGRLVGMSRVPPTELSKHVTAIFKVVFTTNGRGTKPVHYCVNMRTQIVGLQINANGTLSGQVLDKAHRNSGRDPIIPFGRTARWRKMRPRDLHQLTTPHLRHETNALACSIWDNPEQIREKMSGITTAFPTFSSRGLIIKDKLTYY